MLSIQYWMHPLLSEFPSRYTYKGRLRNGEGCLEISVDAVFTERLLEWARSHLPSSYTPSEEFEEFARLLGVNVMKAKVVVNQVTFSRSNPEVVKVVSDMLSTSYVQGHTVPDLEDHNHNFIQRPKGCLSEDDQRSSGKDGYTL